LKNLLHNIIDPHTISFQNSNLSRPRNYDGLNEKFSLPHPKNASRNNYIMKEWKESESVQKVHEDLYIPNDPTELGFVVQNKLCNMINKIKIII
jgi:hypothetical protein